MWHTQDGMGWWMMFGGVMWLLLIALLVFAAITVARSSARDAHPRTRSESEAVEIARRRYAGGEISRDEFDRILRDLNNDQIGRHVSRPA
jgi:putative membrane protein